MSRAVPNYGEVVVIRGKGDSFGELALLRTVQRSATVTVQDVTRVLCLDLQVFHLTLCASTKVGGSAG